MSDINAVLPSGDHLDQNNYAIWAFRCEQVLTIKGYGSCIYEAPAADASEEVILRDKKAKAIICLSVKEHHVPTLMQCTTAKAVWDTLQALFKSKSIARRIQLRKDFSALSKLPGEPLTIYFSRGRNVMSELQSIGDTVQEADVVINLLVGLPNDYAIVVEIIQQSTDTLTLDDVLGKLLPVEQRLSQSDIDAKAFLARTGLDPRGGFRGGGNTAGNKGSGGSNPHRDKVCHYCGKKGHVEAVCYKKARDEKNAQPESSNVAVAFFASVLDTPALSPLLTITEEGNTPDSCIETSYYAANQEIEPEAGFWVMDSGSTRHLTYDKSLLRNIRPTQATVKFGNGAVSTAELCGDLSMYVPGDTGINTLVLKDVLFVPGLGVNLMSVKQAEEKGCEVTFYGGRCTIRRDGRVLMWAPRSGDLYALHATYPSNEEVTLALFAGSTPAKASLWHRRFGHLSYGNMTRMLREQMVVGVDTPVADFVAAQTSLCEPCVLGKQQRHSYPSSASKTTQPLELLHMDVCGPMPVMSLGGSKYNVVFLDDYTSLSVTRTVATKSQVKEVVQEVIAMLETQSGLRVKAVRSDNGSEYINSTLDEYFKSKGIVHQLSAPYSPEQNGKAERLNRTLVERMRSMLVDAGGRDELWAEAINTANYIRNRSPVAGKDMTPWELFTHNKPDVSHMRVFGCAAYAHVPKQLRRKLDPVCVKGIFVGYEPNAKAYRVLQDHDGAIVVSRDVTFNELITTVDAGKNNTVAMAQMIDEEEEHPAVTAGEAAGEEAEEDFQDPAGEVASDGDEAPADNGDNIVGVRRSTRAHRPPGQFWLLNANEHVAANIVQASDGDPLTYAEAMQRPDSLFWQRAMDEEVESLLANRTWDEEEVPEGVKLINGKWVYKLKRDLNGNPERYKARWVAKGFQQREGIDFNEVFAPTSKHTTLRALLSIVASRDLELHQLDVTTAFLHGDLEEDIWMKHPTGYDTGGKNKACHLRKALYGLRQAPRAWHTKLKGELEGLGFVASGSDPGLYILHQKLDSVYVLVYVDDLLIAGEDEKSIDAVKTTLKTIFKIRELDANLFVGIEITRNRSVGTLKVSQRLMASELVSKYGMSDAKVKSTPMSTSVKLVKGNADDALDTQTCGYCELVGSLLYLTVCTRPDIAQAVGALTRYMAYPSEVHWSAAKTVLRYLSGTLDFGITFSKGDTTELVGYADADFAGDIDTRRSTTGYVFLLNGGVISWSSRLQPTVAASTTESEYMAAFGAVKEALWLRKLMNDLDVHTKTIKIYGDNQAALKLLKHPIASVRSKHIDIIYHFARERVSRNEVTFEGISTDIMVADIMTKALPESKFIYCRKSMGMDA